MEWDALEESGVLRKWQMATWEMANVLGAGWDRAGRITIKITIKIKTQNPLCGSPEWLTQCNTATNE